MSETNPALCYSVLSFCTEFHSYHRLTQAAKKQLLNKKNIK